MKRIFIIISLTSLLFSCSGEQRVKMLSFNVHHCCPAGSDSTVYDGIAQFIMEVGPDVVALQELDHLNGRTDAAQIEELKSRTGMYGYFGKSIDFRGGGYGNGILCREEPLRVDRMPLPGKEPRSMMAAVFQDYVFICTHLCLVAQNREASADIINEYAASLEAEGKPVFLAGDLNTDDLDGVFFRRLLDKWEIISGEECTYPNRNANTRIDFILSYRPTGKKVKVDVAYIPKGDRVKAADLSDHLPILTEVKF